MKNTKINIRKITVLVSCVIVLAVGVVFVSPLQTFAAQQSESGAVGIEAEIPLQFLEHAAKTIWLRYLKTMYLPVQQFVKTAVIICK
jgi:hypothetical protein